MDEFIWNNKKISFTSQGQGFAVVLLHGYLETKEVWSDFAQRLTYRYQVIIPDIPGHGGSEVIAEIHSMELMAQAIQELLKKLDIEKCLLIGHSMGGYVTLAFARQYPAMVAGLVLFHSSVFADTEEKKKNRLEEINQIENGNLHQIIANHLPKTFATENVAKFKPVLDKLHQKALTHHAKGVCALIRGMMERPDRQELIRNFKNPLLFIFGEKDNFISAEAANKMALLNPKTEVKWLSKSGHMGFVEESHLAKIAIELFINKALK